MECGVLLRIVDVMNLILILSHPFNTQGREPCLCYFIENNFKVGLYSDIYRPISVKLGILIENI